MPFNWSKYIELADFLHQTAGKYSDEESCLRSSISRSYYAAFCYTRDEAIKKGKRFSSEEIGKEHLIVREWYRPSKPMISMNLKRLMEWRKTCDYENDEIANLKMVSQKALQYAKEIISKCDEPVI